MPIQNRRQKVVSWGFMFVREDLRSCRGAWYSNLTKIPLTYSVSDSISWGSLELCLGGLSPPKPSCGDGIVPICYCRICNFAESRQSQSWVFLWFAEEEQDAEQNLLESEWTNSQKNETPSISGVHHWFLKLNKLKIFAILLQSKIFIE